MVGNDVVDLGDPESAPETLHPRFDARVFTPSERGWITASVDRTRARWVLWAAKEAAYKLARKLVADTIFSPVRFAVALRPSAPNAAGSERGRDLYGRVRLGEREFAVRVTGAREWVHAVATLPGDGFQRPLTGLARLTGADSAPSRAVRELACDAISRRFGLAPGALEVGRCGKIPRLLLSGRPAALDLSLSHHGAFVAFACAPAGSRFANAWEQTS